jgi:hypothetical protein
MNKIVMADGLAYKVAAGLIIRVDCLSLPNKDPKRQRVQIAEWRQTRLRSTTRRQGNRCRDPQKRTAKLPRQFASHNQSLCQPNEHAG